MTEIAERLSSWPLTALAQGQKSKRASGKARG
jgi:hypothetical protein